MSGWFARERVSRPGGYRLDRILRAARAAYDDAALRRVSDRLDAGMRERLDALLADTGEGTGFARLAADPSRVSLESLLTEIDKLELLRRLALPPDLLHGVHPEQIKRFRRRAAIETAWELRRHPVPIKVTMPSNHIDVCVLRHRTRVSSSTSPVRNNNRRPAYRVQCNYAVGTK